MNRIPLRPLALAVTMFAAALVVAPRTASPDVPASDLAASWWVETRSAYVIGKLTFTQDTAIAGAFDVTGALMVRMPLGVAETEGCRPVEFFTVTTPGPPDPDTFTKIALGPRGHLKGLLELTGADGCKGTLEIIRGRDRPAFGRNSAGELDKSVIVRRLALRTRLTIGARDLRRIVSLRGVNLSKIKASPEATKKLERWQGETPTARLRGTRLASNRFGVNLTASADPLGFPFLDLHASGAVRLERVRRDGVDLRGIVAVARSRRGLVRLDATGELEDELGGGWGRTQHFITEDGDPEGPLVIVLARMTPAVGPVRGVVLTANLKPQ